MLKYLVIIALIFSSLTHAQFIESYGFKLGVSFNKLDKNVIATSNYNWNTFDWRSTNSLSYRIFVNHFDHPYLQMQSEFIYSSDRLFLDEGVDIQIREWTNLVYGLSLKLKKEYNKVTPYLLLGSQLKFFVAKDNGPDDLSIEDRIFGLTTGAGITFDLFSTTLILEYRFEKDLQDIIKEEHTELKTFAHLLFLGIEL